MDINAGERLYVKWTPTPATSDQLEITLDGGATWHDLTAGVEDDDGVWTADPAGTVHAILVASPTATGNPAGTLEPGAGTFRLSLRYQDNPEILIRDAGYLRVQ